MDYSLPAQSNSASYRELFGAVRRQKWLILSIVGGFAAVGLALSFLTEKQYVSSRTVVLEGRTQQFNSAVADPLRAVQPATQEDLPTQIEVLQSQTILSQVLQKLASVDPELIPRSATDPSVVARQVGATNSVEIQVFSSNPRLAQEVAEAIPQEFGDYVKTTRRQGVQRGLTTVKEQLAQETQGLNDAQKKLDTFRRTNRLSPSDTEATELSQQVQNAENQLIGYRSDVASQEENVRILVQQRALLPKTIPDPTQEQNNTQIEGANNDLSRLVQERDDLLTQYEADAPQVVALQARIDAQKKYIQSIPKRLSNERVIRNPQLLQSDAAIVDAKSRLAGAQGRVKSQEQFLHDKREQLQNYNLLQARLAELRRDVDRRSQSVTQLQGVLNNIVPLRDSVGDPVKVLSPASPAIKSKPNPPLYIVISIFLGSIVAGVIALVREKSLDRVNTLDEAYRIADVPTLGYIPPRIFGRNAKKTGKLPTRVMENYRIVRSNVLFSDREHPFRSLMVTSTGRGEGKSEVASNLAIAMASGGKKVLLVDAHLHAPSLHERFNLPRTPGLSEVVTDEADLLPSIQSTEIEGLYVLPAGERKVSLADGMGGGKMTRLHERMVESFDMVIFDTPPMLPRSDALGLSTTVETVVYVVRPGETTKTLMRYSIELLRHAHARLLGVVFTNTDFYEEAA